MRPTRPAYTLMEMVLVMALIVIAVAIAVPTMQAVFADTRIAAAGDVMRGQMAETRARAMDESRPWKLAVLPGSRMFQLAPEDSTEWQRVSQDIVRTSEVIRDELPKEVYFGEKFEDIMSGSEPMNAGKDWVAAAVFVPDGSARDDTVTYFGKPGIAPMAISLRGLTGVVTVYAVKESK